MSKLIHFFGTCLLIASFSAVAFADGGATQTPPAPPPPGQCVEDSTEVNTPNQPPQESWLEVEAAVDMLANWIALAIL
jgi:hypothetical protein